MCRSLFHTRNSGVELVQLFVGNKTHRESHLLSVCEQTTTPAGFGSPCTNLNRMQMKDCGDFRKELTGREKQREEEPYQEVTAEVCFSILGRGERQRRYPGILF
ncbi:unnamed protein product [Eretmochelys imbricata]